MSDAFKNQKIVIVEDNVALSDIYKTRLEMLGYNVFAAYDGVQALSVIERERPDLVLLDLMVPKKAGDQVLEEMRQAEWGKDIKVLIISNLNELDAPAGLRNLGIEGYAVKANLSNDQLDQLVDVILKPAGQVEDVLLANNSGPVVVEEAPHNPDAVPHAVNPLSGIAQSIPPAQPIQSAELPTRDSESSEDLSTYEEQENPDSTTGSTSTDHTTSIASVWPQDEPANDSREDSGKQGENPATKAL